MARLSWTWIYDLANRKDLSRNAKALAQALRMHMTDAGENCYPSLVRLMRETGMSKKTLLKAFEELKSKGWLVIVRRAKNGAVRSGDSTLEYVPEWPEGWESDGGNWEFDGGKRAGDGGISASHIRKRKSERDSYKTQRENFSFKDQTPTLRDRFCADCKTALAVVYMQGKPQRCGACADKAERSAA